MKSCFKIFVLFFLFFSCTLRGSIVEYIDFKDDGSGIYRIVLDLKDSHRLLKSVDNLDKNSQNAQIFLYNSFNAVSEKLSKINGVSNVTLTYDTHMLEFTISFHFRDLKTLNRALHIINKLQDDKDSIAWQNEKFVRTINSAEKIFENSIEDDGRFETLLGFKLFFKKVKYIMIYTFEGKRVRSPTTGYKLLSTDMSSITYECFFVDLNDNYNQTIFLSLK